MNSRNTVSNDRAVTTICANVATHGQAASFFKRSKLLGWAAFVAAYCLIAILVLLPGHFL